MSKIEKCPSCGEDMEFGYIVSNYTISWCDHKPRFSCRCSEKLAGGFFGCAAVPGHRCRKCRIIRYTEKK